jgi:hypothetical protein
LFHISFFSGLLLVAHSPVGGHSSDPKSVLKGVYQIIIIIQVFTQDHHLSQLVHFHLLVAVFLGLLLVAHSPVGGHSSDPKSVLKGLLLVAHSPVGGHSSDPKSVLKELTRPLLSFVL